MRTLLSAVATLMLLTACSGKSSPATPTPPAGETPVVAPTVSAAPSPTPAGQWHAGPPIDSSVSTFSLPALRDDRRLGVEGSLGSEIILDAKKEVPYLPGEPVGQGAKGYDQIFRAWNPATGSMRDLWTNEGKRNEAILDIDGEWVLSELDYLNPYNLWTLRLRNLSTGEVRDIDQEFDAKHGLEGAVSPQLNGGHVVYVRLSRNGTTQTYDVTLYEIASATSRTLAHAERQFDGPGSSIVTSSVDGNRVSWTRQETVGGPYETVVADVANGAQRVVGDASLGSCQLIREADALMCGRGYETLVYDLTTASATPLSNTAAPAYHSWSGYFWSFRGDAFDVPAILYDSRSRQYRMLQRPNYGVTSLLVDGWFTWIEWTDDADGRHDFAASTIHALRLR